MHALHRNNRTVAACGLAALALALLGGCSGSARLTHEESCKQRFAKLHRDFEKGRYDGVREPLSALITSCPGSGFIEQAIFELAEAYYHLEDWVAAESEYKSFLREFPRSPEYAEKARFRLAQALARQVHIPQRDQSDTREAIRAFQDFLDGHPDSEFADEARAEIKRLKGQLAEKEMQIARLYWRMGEPQAAAIYYKNLLKTYGGLIDRNEVVLKLVRCYIALNQFETAESYLSEIKEEKSAASLDASLREAYRELEEAKDDYARRKKEAKERLDLQGRL